MFSREPDWTSCPVDMFITVPVETVSEAEPESKMKLAPEDSATEPSDDIETGVNLGANAYPAISLYISFSLSIALSVESLSVCLISV
jgi:hypothetical protein